MLRELCLRSGVLVPQELMQSSSSLANCGSMQVPLSALAIPSLSFYKKDCGLKLLRKHPDI